jgi:Holliday junction resolvase RusA-like endonuclease
VSTGPVLQFRVAGTPSTQGSKTGFAIKSKATGKYRAVIVDKNPKTLKPWREAVRSTAVEALGDGWVPLDGPVRVLCAFAVARPSSAPKTRRTWPTGARSGDVDKLARAVLDALTDAGVWADDARVIDLRVLKDYPGEAVAQTTPGVLVRVWRADQPMPGGAPDEKGA